MTTIKDEIISTRHLIGLSATVVGLYLTSLYSYLLFHSLAEILSIMVAFGVFMIAWNSRKFMVNDYLLFIGIAYLFIGGIDLIHTLSYKGMGVFPEHFGSNLPTQLWLAARYMEAGTLFVAPFMFRRRIKAEWVLTGYGGLTGILLGTIFLGIFPAAYVEGSGLTTFKIVSEYVISIVLAGSLYLLNQRKDDFDAGVFKLLAASIVITIGSEIAFTFYISVYGFSNLVGHYFKLVSFYLVYKALIETGLREPYTLLFRDLDRSEKKYRALFDNMQNGFALHRIVTDETGRAIDYEFLEVNKAFEDMTGLKVREVVGKRVTEVIPGIEHDPADWIGTYARVAQGGEQMRFEQFAEALNRWYTVTAYCPKEGYFATVFDDITDRKEAEEEIKTYNEMLDNVAKFPAENPSPVLRISAQGEILYKNTAVDRLLQMAGHKEGDVFRLLPPDTLKKIGRALESGEVEGDLEIDVLNKTFSYNLVPLKERGYVNFYAVDITERKKAEEALQKAHDLLDITNEELTAANEELMQSNEELARAEERWRTSFNSIGDGISIHDADMKIVQANNSLADILRMSKEEILGRHCYGLFHGTTAPISRCPAERCTLSGTPESLETYEPRLGRWLNISCSPLINDRENFGFVHVIRDVTDRKEYEEALEKYATDLGNINKELEAFSYSVSHDLRAPLRAIDGFSELLQDNYAGGLDDKARRYLDRIRSNVKHLGDLIDDILELSRVVRADIVPDDVDLSRIAGEVVERLMEMEPERKVEVDIPNGIAAPGDKTLLRQVMDNLIGNAWKFTGKKDNAAIEFGVEEAEGKRIFYVRDNGAGFDEAFADKLFGTFQRLHSSEEFPGTGVGLATVQRIVRRHGGEVWAKGEVAKGATFYFTLGKIKREKAG